MTTIRRLLTFDDMDTAVDLQKIYWGDNADYLVPAHMLFTIASSGGHVLAAMNEEQMIGLLIGMVGTDISEPDRPAMANLLIASKRMVVLPAYRGQGIGYQLKLAQRDLAIQHGIRLITWTFDPLLSTNAYFNLRKLGAISQKYLQNYYGTNPSSSLVSLGTSDRLSVEWWITNYRVEQRINGERAGLSLQHYLEAGATITNLSYDDTPPDELQMPDGAFALLEIPSDYNQLLIDNVSLAQSWREHNRIAFQRLMRQGYIVTDFVREPYKGHVRSFYLLSLASDRE